MSLLSDPDYMIHQLRLTYLRTVEDPYASRLLSFNPRHLENPHVIAAGLADPDRWPQLRMPSTPKPAHINIADSPILSKAVQPASSRDEPPPRWNGPGGGTGGASLKYTTTIMGPTRIGMVGMRTNGHRSTGSAGSIRGKADGNPVVNIQEASVTPSNGPTEIRQPQPLQDSDPAIEQPIIAPHFSRNAEIEARRKARIQTRHGFADLRAQHQAGKKLAIEEPVIDGEDGAQDGSSESDSEDSDDMGVAPDDELDLDYEGQHLANSAGSDEGSLPSTASGISTSQSSGYPIQSRSSRKLSQTTEANRLGTHTEENTSDDEEEAKVSESGKTRVHTLRYKSDAQSPPSSGAENRHNHRRRPPSLEIATPKMNSAKLEKGRESQPQTANSLDFSRRSVPKNPAQPPTSTLTKMLVAQAAVSDNPFTELYGAIAGRGDVPSMKLDIYFPESKKPLTPVKITVRKDATVEEVIGFALWTYWEQKLEPPLDDGLEEDDAQRTIVLSAAGWVLRITEDGEVDEDFPAPDRAAKIAKFSFPEFAICRATPSQVQQNRVSEAKIVRRLSRLMIAKKRPAETTNQASAQAGQGAAGPGGLGAIQSMGELPSIGVSSSVGGTAHTGPQVFLRICVPEDADAVLRYTTINVTADWYMADVLEHICRRRKIKDHQDYALVSQEKKIVIPMDRTVASLQGETELMLVKRSALGEEFKPPGRATNPNDSIFGKRMSEVPGPTNGPVTDFTDAYQSWVVYRKLPVMVGRLERTLAIDGDHIHIMPSTKGFLDNPKTTSYRIDAIQSVRHARKAPQNVKLKVSQDGTHKTYDFEAENETTAEIIVQRIKSLIKSSQPKRASTLRRR